MKPILFAALVCLFLPTVYPFSRFSSAVPLARHNKLRYQQKNALSPPTRRNFPFFTTPSKTRSNNNNNNSQLHALPMTVSTAAISLLRGGGESILNLSRESYHLQALASYGTVTALIMNAALRLYSSTKFPKRKDNATADRVNRHMNSIFTAITSLCIISGAFTAVLFNILGIYSKSALGMLNEEGYIAFQLATHVYTKWGFRAFLTTCMSFVGSFLLSVYSKISSDVDESHAVKEFVFVGAVLLALVAAFHIKQVLNLATKLIFTPEYLTKLGA